jgi:hypothetical protein
MARSFHKKLMKLLKKASFFILRLFYPSKRRKIKKLRKARINNEPKKRKGKKFKPTFSSLEKKQESILSRLIQKDEKKLKSSSEKEIEIENVKEDNNEDEEIRFLSEIKHSDHDFICPICLKYIVSATTTVCGHTFCEMCISEYLLFYSVINFIIIKK